MDYKTYLSTNLSYKSTILGVFIGLFSTLLIQNLSKIVAIGSNFYVYFILLFIIIALFLDIKRNLRYDLSEFSKGDLPDNSIDYFLKLHNSLAENYSCKYNPLSKKKSISNLIMPLSLKFITTFNFFIAEFVVLPFLVLFFIVMRLIILYSPTIPIQLNLLLFLLLIFVFPLVGTIGIYFRNKLYKKSPLLLQKYIYNNTILKNENTLIRYNLKSESTYSEFPLELILDLNKKSFHFKSNDSDSLRTKEKIIEEINKIIDNFINP